jgi:hypothetical protein
VQKDVFDLVLSVYKASQRREAERGFMLQPAGYYVFNLRIFLLKEIQEKYFVSNWTEMS